MTHVIAGESGDSRVGVALLTEVVSEPFAFVVAEVADFALLLSIFVVLIICDGSTATLLFFE